MDMSQSEAELEFQRAQISDLRKDVRDLRDRVAYLEGRLIPISATPSDVLPKTILYTLYALLMLFSIILFVSSLMS